MNSNWNYVPFNTLFNWCEKSNIGSRQAVENGKYTLYIASATEKKKYNEYLHDGEALVFGTGGNPAIHYATNKFAYTNHTEAAIAKDNSVSLKFYYYYFQLNKCEQLRSTFVGGGIKNSSKKKIGELLVPIVDIDVQEKIVAKIEELFSELDNNIETLQSTKKQLAVYRQAVLKAAFEGNFPKRQLGEISTAISGYAFSSKKYATDGQYVVLKIGNVKQFKFDFSRDLTKTNEVTEDILNKYLLRRGDCLITMTGSRGKRDYGYISLITDQTNYLLNQRVAALRFDQNIALPEFYQYYLSSFEFRNQFFLFETGNVGQGNVGIKALTDTIVVCPSIEQQRQIILEIESHMSTCDNVEKTVDAALQQAEAMRQSILKKAFEGEL